MFWVLEGSGDVFLGLRIGVKVSEDEVVVFKEEVVDEGEEEVGVFRGEEARGDELEDFAHVGVGFIDMASAVALIAFLRDFFFRQPKQEEVFSADAFANFNIGAVQSPEGESAIHSEFHITGAGGFHACGADLLTDVRGGDKAFGEGDAVVWDEAYRQAGGLRVRVDDVGDTVDEADNEFCALVAGGAFGAEEEDAFQGGWDVLFSGLNPQVDNVQGVEQLAFILMEAFNLNVEDGLGRDFHFLAGEEVFCQVRFVGQLDGGKLLDEGAVVGEVFKLSQVLQVRNPRSADMFGNECGQAWVARQEPTSGSDAVGFVVKALREHFCKVRQHGFLEQVRVQGCNAINAMGADDGQVSHANHLLMAFFHQGHARKPCCVEGIAKLNLSQEAVVDLINNLEVPGQKPLEQGDGPFFQGFAQQGMVGITEGSDRNFPSFVPSYMFFVDEYTHQLSDGDGGVGVIELDGDFIGECVEIVVGLQVAADDVGDGASDEEIFLFEAQLFAGLVLVIWVEHFGDDFRVVFVNDRGLVVAVVEEGEVKLF